MELFAPAHLMIVLLIALLLFGGKKLPELARAIGTSMNELKKGISENDDSEQKQIKGYSLLRYSRQECWRITDTGYN